MPLFKDNSEMPRLFVAFGTFDRTWDSGMYTRELSPLDMDTSMGGIQFVFQTDHIVGIPDGKTTVETKLSFPCDNSFYLEPHRSHVPLFLGQQNVFLQRKCNSSRFHCQPLSFIRKQQKMDFFRVKDCVNSGNSEKTKDDELYFILPMKRCTVVVDAHVASCINVEYHRSRTFRHRFFHKIRKSSGFRDCKQDYENWTQEEREAWDNYLSIPFMINVIAIWPWQKIDHAWSDRILNLFNKHVTLEESLAWLSTLGGAHSSLGETFIDHAERAGEISLQQLKLARELGNEVMIARCYLYWAWSLLQRDYLTKCKICILNTWKYVKKTKCADKVLTNMCRAVWSRLQYKRSLISKKKDRCSPGSKDSGHWDKDSCGCGSDSYNNSIKTSRIRMQSIEVC